MDIIQDSFFRNLHTSSRTDVYASTAITGKMSYTREARGGLVHPPTLGDASRKTRRYSLH